MEILDVFGMFQDVWKKLPGGWKEREALTLSQRAGAQELEGKNSKNKFRFKQSNITQFFENKELLILDKEMKQLDMKSRKEN